MRKLLFLFVAAAYMAGCSGAKSDKAEKENEEKENVQDEDAAKEEESSIGNWSAADKNKLKKEWAKTFAKWKEGLQGETDFDEADFDTESKRVVSCTLGVLENKFESYAKYKKANDKDHFQSDPELLNEMGNCTDNLMQKYNRDNQ